MDHFKSLETQGYHAIRLENHERLNAAVREAADAWMAFCALPDELKQRFDYSGDTAVGSGVGYELKKQKDAHGKDLPFDLKEDFHARAKSRQLLMHEATKVGPTAISFVAAALNISAHLSPVVREFTRLAERAYGMPHFERDTLKAMALWTMRFNHYFPSGDATAIIATQHTDKGCFTPHLFESDAGLERLTMHPDPAQRVWEPMPVNTRETVIFPGLRLQLRSRNKLKATCHRVIANERTALVGRYSAVAFCDSLNTPYFDKERVGRTQNFGPGFNYDMPFTEYEKLFKVAKVAA
jgi:isopenicillin N synthase-like dioxygenase